MTQPEMSATPKDIAQSVRDHLTFSIGKDAPHASVHDWRVALSLAVRDRIVEPWFASTRATYDGKLKRVHYLSMEFLIGRLLEDSIVNLGLDDMAREALHGFGVDYDEVIHDEPEAALGNGGLGRLAACYMESMATLGCPAYGYGLRYEHGLFRQRFDHGRQVETAENWLKSRNPWEFERPEAAYEIGFGGWVEGDGPRKIWHPAESVIAAAYDMPVIGWRGRWANTLRLWSGKPVQEFDLERFNRGEYVAAGAAESLARTITRVLYPDDSTEAGKELRLKQEYFFTAASVRDIMRRFASGDESIAALPDRVAIQMNDTHPSIAGAELVRVLIDDFGQEFDAAADMAVRVLNYTNHTLLPEALETWSEGLFRKILPRHMDLVERIDDHHKRRNPSRPWELSAIHHGQVHMGTLAFMQSGHVNGVSALHTDLMKETVFHDLNRLHPDRIVNVTNGVTPRRWLYSANPTLAGLITETLGDEEWVDHLDRLKRLEPSADDSAWLDRYAAAKRSNKVALSNWLGERLGIVPDPDALFDVQIKRIHEYKRQLLNVLETISRWDEIRQNPGADWQPRVKIFGGKAAPGYVVAKEIVHLINDVAAVVNKDPAMQGRLIVAYPANYNVSMAVRLIPAADLSEQISTAGKEASGTGNMKLSMNGALTIGTLDGANVEIREQVGAENFFLFGMNTAEVEKRRAMQDHAAQAIAESPALARAIELIAAGTFGGDRDRYGRLVDILRKWDDYLVCSDFADYRSTQGDIDAAYRDQRGWNRMAALNTARMGWFSSDRSIRDYMSRVWDMEASDEQAARQRAGQPAG
ncbi:glycogen/starch/alpha-glucan phosphorylase [Paracoccus aerodenitrificans]|uniref:glycogen/starch/alpha-glucan phosphorylase n=1 Tax=Paracoccus aerodenitrificans TaxID=3017781 RepID=UPI0022F06AAA|nr:glycogen/starch/alpha-glucan phosphorylase [Paracoccus aerodenitrificans]WBU62808.1 glycogen/starch/alpha-glucan phosphorylase [Paracoccus aerodenitrificans]